MNEEGSITQGLTLPYPPSANRYWRSARGRVFVSTEAKEFKARVQQLALVERVAMLTGPVKVLLEVYRPAKRGDLDNTLKVLLDSLNGIAYKDDSQIVEITARRFDDKANPRVEVTVSEA